jgi:hypothetical protein
LKHLHHRAGRRRRRNSSRIWESAVIIRGIGFLLLVVICVAGVRWISGGTYRSAFQSTASTSAKPVSLAALAGPSAGAITVRNRRTVYPYSVVPGGVSSPAELREAAAHDLTVAAHYAEFNYARGRVVEVTRPRLVYLSYRRGNHVYWTRKQVSLHQGEKLLTDGRITARTRCANQVSVLPQAQTSPEEPSMAELDRPDAVASGMERFPMALDSSLLNFDPGMPIGPGSPMGSTFAGTPPGVFIPLPIGGPVAGPGGGCPSTKAKSGSSKEKNCTPEPPTPPPPAVPEPGSIVLMLSGAAAILARYRMNNR